MTLWHIYSDACGQKFCVLLSALSSRGSKVDFQELSISWYPRAQRKCHNPLHRASEPYLDELYWLLERIPEQAVDLTQWLSHANIKQRKEGQLHGAHFNLSSFWLCPASISFYTLLFGSTLCRVNFNRIHLANDSIIFNKNTFTQH